jgi:hypothetical protein
MLDLRFWQVVMEKFYHLEHAPYGLLKVNRRFGGTCLRLQGRREGQARNKNEACNKRSPEDGSDIFVRKYCNSYFIIACDDDILHSCRPCSIFCIWIMFNPLFDFSRFVRNTNRGVSNRLISDPERKNVEITPISFLHNDLSVSSGEGHQTGQQSSIDIQARNTVGVL